MTPERKQEIKLYAETIDGTSQMAELLAEIAALEERLRQAENREDKLGIIAAEWEKHCVEEMIKVEAYEKRIASLEAELLELNDAYKRTRLASAEKHEQIRRLREALQAWKGWFDGPFAEGVSYINPPLKRTEEALAQTEEK